LKHSISSCINAVNASSGSALLVTAEHGSLSRSYHAFFFNTPTALSQLPPLPLLLLLFLVLLLLLLLQLRDVLGHEALVVTRSIEW
jgi:hypothetical protein